MEEIVDNESFVFYQSMFDAIDIIDDLKLQAQAYKTIAMYGLFGTEPNENTPNIIKVIFIQAKAVIDKARAKYMARKLNGKLGGAPKGNQNARKNNLKQPKTNKINQNQADENENINKNINEDINERNKENFYISLKNKFPKININVENIDLDKYDTGKIIQAISNSNWLQEAPLSFILQNYTDVINGKYVNIKPKKESGFQTHNYTKEQLNNVFDDIDNIEI